MATPCMGSSIPSGVSHASYNASSEGRKQRIACSSSGTCYSGGTDGFIRVISPQPITVAFSVSLALAGVAAAPLCFFSP